MTFDLWPGKGQWRPAKYQNAFYGPKGTSWSLERGSSLIRSRSIGKNRIRWFWVIDLTSEVTRWPRTLKSDTIGFVSSRATRSSLPRSSSSIRGQTRGGSYHPPPPCAVEDGEIRRKYPIFTFDLTLMWHGNSICKLRVCFRCVSLRLCECHFACLAVIIVSRDNLGTLFSPRQW